MLGADRRADRSCSEPTCWMLDVGCWMLDAGCLEPRWLHNIEIIIYIIIFIYISIVIVISRLARERAVQGSARFASRFGSCPVLSCVPPISFLLGRSNRVASSAEWHPLPSGGTWRGRSGMIYDCLINTEPLKYFPPPPPVSLSAATCECRDIVVVKVVVVILVMILEITINVSNDSRVTYYRVCQASTRVVCWSAKH